LHLPATRSQPEILGLLGGVVGAALLVLVALVVAMIGMQQVPVAHLGMTHSVASEHEHTVETDAHIELESTHDFDDGDPAAPAECCSQTADYVTTVTSVTVAVPVAIETTVALAVRYLDVRVWAAAGPPPMAPNLIQLSIHRV
jgi:hypothetical protein